MNMNNSLSLISIPSDGDSTSGTFKEETTGFVDPSVADGHRLVREFMEVQYHDSKNCFTFPYLNSQI